MEAHKAEIETLVSTFFNCFQSDNPDLLDKLTDLCSSDCMLNDERLDKFIEKRKAYFVDKVYEDFREYETDRVSTKIDFKAKTATHCSVYEAIGLKNKAYYHITSTKTFDLKFDNEKWIIVHVQYY
jgi:hypothetical protein